jgi:hypothetical protein
VWRDLERLGVVAVADSRAGGMVYNGGFERPPSGAGLDWRFNPQPFASLTISNLAHGGSHSFEVQFTGDQNREYEPIFEVVPVEPGRSYALSAFVRSQAITSDAGPRLRVQDLSCSASCLDVATPDTLSTTLWHAVGVSFATQPETHFVRLSIWRPRSRGYPSGIGGAFWVDDVSITEQPAEALRAAIAMSRAEP